MIDPTPQETMSLHFEKSLQELEHIVKRLEQGDINLEEALKQFEQGIKLTRHCQKALQEAEQKITLLSNPSQEKKPAEHE